MKPTILITCSHCGETYDQDKITHLITINSDNKWLWCRDIRIEKGFAYNCV